MELKAYSTKWEHSESPTSRLKYTFWPDNLVNRKIPLTRSVEGAVE